MRTLFATTAAAMLLIACSITPDTWVNAVRGHQELPALSVAILECTAERPDVQDEIREPFNTLVDAWEEARGLELNEELLITLANARHKIANAKSAWLQAKSAVVESGLDCGPWVRASVENIETTFDEITTAIDANDRVVLAWEYASLFADIFAGRKVEVVRIPS